MPPIANHLALAEAGIIAVAAAIAAAVAIYESPELRRYADDVRRRIALALHNMGDGVAPPDRVPLFNRPEDAHAFLASQGHPSPAQGRSAEPGVDADEASRRKQREELMYWNAKRLEKLERERSEKAASQRQQSATLTPDTARATSFDDFLKQDESAEKGTLVFNSGTEVRVGEGSQFVLRRRGEAQGIDAAIYANPFADEHRIKEEEPTPPPASFPAPAVDSMSDIYSTTTQDLRTLRAQVAAAAVLIDAASDSASAAGHEHKPSEPAPTLERQLEPGEYMTAGQDDPDAYASIQAWAQTSHPQFYSPLPTTPEAPMSEPEVISTGDLTPTDSVSEVGSGQDVANDAASAKTDDKLDVISVSDGMPTPTSWSEVGSVVSESEADMVPAR